MWRWATWRHCCKHYDADLSEWPALRDSGLLETVFQDPLERSYWSAIWQRLMDEGHPDTWDYQWAFTCLANNGLSATPNSNLVRNVGFDCDATHTFCEPFSTSTDNGFSYPLAHPRFLIRCNPADVHYYKSRISNGGSGSRGLLFLARIMRVIGSKSARIKNGHHRSN